MNSAQPLHLRAIEKVDQPPVTLPIESDVVIKWIAEDLIGHAAPRSLVPGRLLHAFRQRKRDLACLIVGRDILELACSS